ncbi:MAG: hypothetical protein IT379_24550 [Deltaproteobacteria bacterium]|nr:hypothetical protein [Deltaproteobacteria bacterium]
MRRSRLALVVASVVLASASAGTASAQPSPGLVTPPRGDGGGAADPLIVALREHLLYARYPEAIAEAGSLLTRTDLSARQRVEVLESLAIAQIAENQTQNAQTTLAELYRRDPGHRLSDADASPTVLSAFARAREGRGNAIAVTIENRSPARLARREAPAIELRFTTGRDAVHEARLAYRARGTSEWGTSVMRIGADGNARATIPLPSPTDRSVEMEYWAEARAPSGAPLAQLGSADDPLRVSVPAETRQVRVIRVETPGRGGPVERRGVLEQWWFWTAVGAVIVGGGVAGYVLLGPPSEGPRDGSLGNVTLR